MATSPLTRITSRTWRRRRGSSTLSGSSTSAATSSYSTCRSSTTTWCCILPISIASVSYAARSLSSSAVTSWRWRTGRRSSSCPTTSCISCYQRTTTSRRRRGLLSRCCWNGWRTTRMTENSIALCCLTSSGTPCSLWTSWRTCPVLCMMILISLRALTEPWLTKWSRASNVCSLPMTPRSGGQRRASFSSRH